MADEWYYTNQGQQQGPVSTAELKQLAATQQLQPSDLVWREGLAKWVPANSAKGLFPEAPAAAPAAVPAAANLAPTLVAPMDEDADLRPPRRRDDDYDDRPRRRRRDEDFEDDLDDRPRRRRARSSNKGLIIGLVLGGVGLLVGGVVFVVVLLVLGRGAQALTLHNGQVTVTGLLTTGDSFDQRRPQCRCKTYTINLTGGKVYEINMRSNQIDSYLRLESPSGQLLAEDDDGGGFPNARIVMPVPQTGSYRITCTTFQPAVGDYVLSVQER